MTTWWLGGYGPDMGGTAHGISTMVSGADGSLEWCGYATDAPSPSFLASDGDHVYAAAEGAGEVLSFRREGAALGADGRAGSGGASPCHLEVVDGAIIAANYGGGELGVVSLEKSGALGELRQVLSSIGSGPHPAQGGPHAHTSLALDATTVLSVDLGADRLFLHEMGNGALTRTSELALPAGTGPRDVARHRSGLLYVVGEHDRRIHVVERDGQSLTLISSVELPGADPTDQAAAIAFGAGDLVGDFVYVGLRGSNQVSVLRASGAGRVLEAVGSVSSGGEWPRHLVVDEEVLHVCNQLSNSVASFRLRANGLPDLIAEPTSAPSPTHLLRA